MPQIKNGQPKTVLVSGDSGIGKTCLLKEFISQARKANCQVVALDKIYTVKNFYQGLMQVFEQECQDIINNTLLKINSIYDEKLNWQESDLKNALNIVKLQSSMTPDITSEQVAKSIKSSMKLFSRIKPELDGSIDVLSELLTDPWIIIASNFNNPADEIYRNSLSLLKPVEDASAPLEVEDQVYKEYLLRFLYYLNNHIKQKDTALLIVMDHFELCGDLPYKQRENFKNFISAVLEDINKRMELNLMFVLVCSAEKQSNLLGGNLHTNFTNRLLVNSLDLGASLKLINNIFEAQKINSDDKTPDYLTEYTEGNPFWIYRCINFLDMAAKTINVKRIEENFCRQFLPESATELLHSQLSLLQSTFSENLQLFDQGATFLAIDNEPFSIFDMSKSLGIAEMDCKLVVSELIKYDFLTCSNGEGCRFSHPLVKEFLIQQYKNKGYFNAALLNLLKLLNVVQTQLLNMVDPSESVRYLNELCELSNQLKIAAQLFKMLEMLTAHKEPGVRISAIRGLKVLANLDAIRAIAKVVNDPEIEVRNQALMALEGLILIAENDTTCLDAIITAIKTTMFDKNQTLRFKSIQVLGKIDSKSARDALAALLKDKDEEIRAIALKYLGKLLNNEYYYIFLEKMTDTSPKVRAIAAEQLGKYRTRQSISVLCAGLEDPDKNVRKICAKSLGGLQYSETAISLIKALDDPDEDVRLNVIKSLGRLQNRRALPYLKEILEKPNNDVIYWVTTRALGDIPCKESLDILDKAVESNNSIVQHAALCSIQRINTSLN